MSRWRDDDVKMTLVCEENLLCDTDDSLLLELLPPPTAEASVEPADPQIAPVPKLKKKKKMKKRERALEESATPPKAKKMKVGGDEE